MAKRSLCSSPSREARARNGQAKRQNLQPTLQLAFLARPGNAGSGNEIEFSLNKTLYINKTLFIKYNFIYK